MGWFPWLQKKDHSALQRTLDEDSLLEEQMGLMNDEIHRLRKFLDEAPENARREREESINTVPPPDEMLRQQHREAEEPKLSRAQEQRLRNARTLHMVQFLVLLVLLGAAAVWAFQMFANNVGL